VVNNMQWSF